MILHSLACESIKLYSIHLAEQIQDLLDEHYARMQSYAYAIVKNIQDAEDIVQNVTIIALRKDELLEHENPLGWLLKTTRFEAMNHYRKHRRIKIGLDPEVIHLLEESAYEQKPVESPLIEKVRWCLRQLKEKYQTMFKLRYEDNIKGEALAKQCGIKKEAMYKSLSRCQAILKKCLERHQDE